jgi:hypothetical protein
MVVNIPIKTNIFFIIDFLLFQINLVVTIFSVNYPQQSSLHGQIGAAGQGQGAATGQHGFTIGQQGFGQQGAAAQGFAHPQPLLHPQAAPVY